jgi:peptide/nickel transport system substrate-binding protein
LSGVATDKIDDLTVRYTLPNKYAPFLSLLTINVLPQGAEETMNPLVPVSSADFRVARIEKRGSFISEVYLVTTSSEYSIKKLIFKFYPNDDELNTAAKLGEIEGFMSDSNCCSNLENFTDYKFPIQGIYYALYFNLRNPKFQDLAFRQKLTAVLPINDMITDKGIAVQGPISRSVFTDRALQFDKYDKTVSDSLSDTVIEIKVPDDKSHVNFVDQVKSIWEDKLGLKVVVVKEPAADFVDKVIIPRDFEILFYGQEVGRDPDRYVLWHSAQSNPPGLNLSGFSQIRADRALEEGRNELDPQTRIIHYNEFQKVINEQDPAIFLYHPNEHYYVSKRISGIGQKYTFTYWDRFLDLKNWKSIGSN